MNSNHKVLQNGAEVGLHQNALNVLEHPTGNELNGDSFGKSSRDSDIGEKPHDPSRCIEFQSLSKPPVRKKREMVSPTTTKTAGHYCREVDAKPIIHAPPLKVDLAKLDTSSLRRYCRYYKLAGTSSSSSREQMLHVVQHHFVSQPPLKEAEVIPAFIARVKRLRRSRPSNKK